MSQTLIQYIQQNKQDAVIYKATMLSTQAGEDIYARDLILGPIVKMLNAISSDLLLEHYIKTISKILSIKPVVITNLLRENVKKEKKEEFVQELKENQKAIPKWINKDHYYTFGFDQRNDDHQKENTGIYFAKGNNEAIQLTNFTIKPLIHVFSGDDTNRRLTEINNGYVKEVIELPSRAWASADMFENTLMDKGVFFTYDGFAKSHMNKLKSVFLPQYPRCYELKNLGWQTEGFFAFSNLIYKEGITRFDEYGVAEIEGTKYLSMGASKALAGLRDQDDDYKNDKYLKYVYTDLTFSEWSQYMMDAYNEKGMMGVCFAIMACFKDIIFKRNNNCPIPYLFGAAQSGKSKLGESVASLSTVDMPALNLNQTTEFALWERLGRFCNIPALFNEFDEKSIKEEFTRAFKGAFDGEGRNRGTGKKGKAQTQPINCLPILMGQYLSTGDDGALLQRTLPVKFVEDNNRSDFQLRRFNELKALEKQGITSISCELFQHRGYVSDNFSSRFYKMLDEMKISLAADNLIAKNRILENFVNAITITSLIADKISLAFSIDDFFEYCKDQIKSLSVIISETNALADFWKTVELLVDQEYIEQGYHFKIDTKSEVIVAAKERNQTVKKSFAEPKKLLYLRFNTIHSLYLKEYKNAKGKPGIDAATVQIYMQDQESYIGSSPSSSFRTNKGKSTVTSSYVFDYDLLKVNIERGKDEEDTRVEATITGTLQNDAKVQDILGVLKLHFTLVQDESYWNDGVFIDKTIYTICSSKDTNAVSKLKKGKSIKVSGLLDEKVINESLKRRLEVTTIEILNEAENEPKGKMSF